MSATTPSSNEVIGKFDGVLCAIKEIIKVTDTLDDDSLYTAMSARDRILGQITQAVGLVFDACKDELHKRISADERKIKEKREKIEALNKGPLSSETKVGYATMAAGPKIHVPQPKVDSRIMFNPSTNKPAQVGLVVDIKPSDAYGKVVLIQYSSSPSAKPYECKFGGILELHLKHNQKPNPCKKLAQGIMCTYVDCTFALHVGNPQKMNYREFADVLSAFLRNHKGTRWPGERSETLTIEMIRVAVYTIERAFRCIDKYTSASFADKPDADANITDLVTTLGEKSPMDKDYPWMAVAHTIFKCLETHFAAVVADKKATSPHGRR
jgi:hypothetical protein